MSKNTIAFLETNFMAKYGLALIIGVLVVCIVVIIVLLDKRHQVRNDNDILSKVILDDDDLFNGGYRKTRIEFLKEAQEKLEKDDKLRKRQRKEALRKQKRKKKK